jgi:hypothetical protein
VLEGALKKAAGGADDEARALDTLIRMNALMRSVGPCWDRMMEKVEKRDRTAIDEIGPMDESLAQAVELLPNATFMKSASQDRFRQYGESARTDLSHVRDLGQAGTFDEAQRRAGEIDSKSCAKCHGSYRRTFRQNRMENNLGNGYFSTKLDVVVPDKALEASYQATATAIRKAVLLAAEAK